MTVERQKYRIIEKIGAGGMAEVYRAEVESLEGFKKGVAIKRILPSLTKNQKFVTMFLDEARLSLRLNHANVVHVFDIGQSGNTYFLVMEYVDGLNLRQIVDVLRRRRRRLPLEQSIYIMTELCKGIGYAHDLVDVDTGKALGIVHRDVSPPNVILSRQGEVKVTDFGLAKAAVQVGDTEPGVVKGKFSYLSPEAAQGVEVDHRSDIFACGILLFEMLTGKRLFYGESDWQTVELVRACHVPHMPTLNPDITEEMDMLVRKALAKNPAERYQHAGDFGDALSQHLFARALKVTNRDLARLISDCLSETRDSQMVRSGIAQAIVEEELRRFNSLDEEERHTASVVEAPTRFRANTADLVDTSAWASEMGGTGSGLTIPPKTAAPPEGPRAKGGAPLSAAAAAKRAAEAAPPPSPPSARAPSGAAAQAVGRPSGQSGPYAGQAVGAPAMPRARKPTPPPPPPPRRGAGTPPLPGLSHPAGAPQAAAPTPNAGPMEDGASMTRAGMPGWMITVLVIGTVLSVVATALAWKLLQ